MKNKISLILITLATLLFASRAGAYYSPSTGRWLSRDPMGEPGFETIRAAYKSPQVGQITSTASLPPSRILVRDTVLKNDLNEYAFVKNDPESKVDLFGLESEPDISWAPRGCPDPAHQTQAYIQVVTGYGSGGPRVDNGSLVFPGWHSTGCPLYPLPPETGSTFQDTPKGLSGDVTFTVCSVCLTKCSVCQNPHRTKGPAFLEGYKIVGVGPCVTWKFGDKGNLGAAPFTQSDGPNQNWHVGMDTDFPDASKGGCFHCASGF